MLDTGIDPMSKQSADNYVQAVMATNTLVVPVEIHAERPVSNFNTSITLTPRINTKRRRSGDNSKRGTKKQKNSSVVFDNETRHALVDRQWMESKGNMTNNKGNNKELNSIEVIKGIKFNWSD